MEKVFVLELPINSSAALKSPEVLVTGGSVVISMELDDEGIPWIFRLKFRNQRAFRTRSEAYLTPWQITGLLDTVCEVKDSDWVEELRAAALPERRDRWVMRHFMICIDDVGCLEVVAESVDLDQETKNSEGT